MDDFSTPEKYFAILEGQIPKSFGTALWIIVLSFLGFLLGAVILVYALISGDSSAFVPGIVIIVVSVGIIGVTLFLAPVLSRRAKGNRDNALYGIVVSNGTLQLGSWNVKIGKHEIGSDGEKLKPVKGIISVGEPRSMPSSRDGINLLISVDVVPDNTIVKFNDRIRIKSIALVQGDEQIWSSDLSNGSTYRMAVSEGKCHYLPLYTSAKTTNLLKTLRVIGDGLRASWSRLDTMIQFNFQHLSLTLSAALLGAFGMTTAAIGNIQAEKEFSKKIEQGTLKDKKSGMTFQDMVDTYGWKVDIRGRDR